MEGGDGEGGGGGLREPKTLRPGNTTTRDLLLLSLGATRIHSWRACATERGTDHRTVDSGISVIYAGARSQHNARVCGAQNGKYRGPRSNHVGGRQGEERGSTAETGFAGQYMI